MSERRLNQLIFVCTILLVPLTLWIVATLTVNAGVAAIEGNRVAQPDCTEFEFDSGIWADGDSEERADQAAGIARCHSFEGFRADSIEVLLGQPDRVSRKGHRWTWEIPQDDSDDDFLGPRELNVNVKDGEVRSTSFFQPESGYSGGAID